MSYQVHIAESPRRVGMGCKTNVFVLRVICTHIIGNGNVHVIGARSSTPPIPVPDVQSPRPCNHERPLGIAIAPAQHAYASSTSLSSCAEALTSSVALRPFRA